MAMVPSGPIVDRIARAFVEGPVAHQAGFMPCQMAVHVLLDLFCGAGHAPQAHIVDLAGERLADRPLFRDRHLAHRIRLPSHRGLGHLNAIAEKQPGSLLAVIHPCQMDPVIDVFLRNLVGCALVPHPDLVGSVLDLQIDAAGAMRDDLPLPVGGLRLDPRLDGDGSLRLQPGRVAQAHAIVHSIKLQRVS